MILLLILTVSSILILITAGMLFNKSKSKTLSICFFYGYAMQILLALPAGICQPYIHDNFNNTPWFLKIVVPFLGNVFNAGGFTVRWVFESTVEPLEWLVGHRSATVLSNMPYFLFLLAIQASILAFLFAFRYKKRQSLKDPMIITIVILFLINSFANINWPYWGT
jgi:hypothetical protein